MKVRCNSCGKVVKVSGPTPPVGISCPACRGALLEGQSQGQSQTSQTGIVSQSSSTKGKVQAHSKATALSGYVAVMLVLVCSGVLARTIGADSGLSWLVWLLGIIAAVVVGIWFQNKSRKEKQ
jgi:hypothetical protein